jgi:hypothetical protein
MNLDQLKAAGGFVDPTPVKQSVTWQGVTFDVYIRRHSFAEFERLHVEYAKGGKAQGALMLSTYLLLGDDKQPMSYEDAARLEPTLAKELVEALNKVAAESPKPSPPTTSSGANSRSRSGGGPSRNSRTA